MSGPKPILSWLPGVALGLAVSVNLASAQDTGETKHRVLVSALAGEEVIRKHSQKNTGRTLVPGEGWTTVTRTFDVISSITTGELQNSNRSEVKFTRIGFSEEIPVTGRKVVWDSDNWQIGTPYGAIAGPYLDKRFLLRRDDDYRPKDVIGVPGEGKITSETIMEITCPGEWYVYPKEPIAAGHKWEVTKILESHANGRIEQKGEAVFKGLIERGQQKLFQVDVEGTLTVEPLNPDRAAKGGKLKGGTFKQSFFIDPATGLVLEVIGTATTVGDGVDVDGRIIELKTVIESTNVVVEEDGESPSSPPAAQ